MTGAIHLPDAIRLEHHQTIDSTSDEAKRLAEAGAPEGTLVVADEQTAGRGRRGRPWVSPTGNLHCSLLLRPRASVREAAQLGFAASLAVAEAAERFLPTDKRAACKWPNDVLVGGAKLAGILPESRGGPTLEWLVLGIGVNLAAHPEDTEYPATSLAASGAGRVTPDAFLAPLVERLLAWYAAWAARGFPALKDAWLARAERLGQPIRVRLPNEEMVGRFAGLDEDGRLVLDAEAGRRYIAAADVFPAV